MDDIEGIERATFAAMPPQRLQAWGDWLLGLDDGTVGRSHSAVPIRHDAPAAGGVDAIARRYAAAGLAPVFRLPEVAAFEGMRDALAQRGYVRARPTLVQTGSVAAMAMPAPAGFDVELADAPGPEWEDVFLGQGFDPRDGASRLAILRRARDSVFASVRLDGRIAAVGSACIAHGWCGVHGMRAAATWRRRGLAGAILSALAQAASRRNATRCFLQVEEGNAAARSVYERRGFATAWSYAYWQRPQPARTGPGYLLDRSSTSI